MKQSKSILTEWAFKNLTEEELLDLDFPFLNQYTPAFQKRMLEYKETFKKKTALKVFSCSSFFFFFYEEDAEMFFPIIKNLNNLEEALLLTETIRNPNLLFEKDYKVKLR